MENKEAILKALYSQIMYLNTDDKEELKDAVMRAEAVSQVVKNIVEIEKLNLVKTKLLLQNGYKFDDSVKEAGLKKLSV